MQVDLYDGSTLFIDVTVEKAGQATIRFVRRTAHGSTQANLPLRAIFDTWPLIEAALTLRGLKP